MAETTIASGSSLAIKHYSAALFANTLRGATALENLVGPVEPTSAMQNIAGQTQPGMPLVRIDNLMKGAGDAVSLDLVRAVPHRLLRPHGGLTRRPARPQKDRWPSP